jgi:hypothetical protein
MKRAWLFIVLLLGACAPNTPEQVGQKYCAALGNPDADTVLRRMIGQNLRDEWDTAKKMSAILIRGKDTTFPRASHLRLQAYPQAAPLCQVAGDPVVQGRRAVVTIYRGWPQNAQPGWTDRLDLVRENGAWVIDNIEFAPVYQESLRQFLQGTLLQ